MIILTNKWASYSCLHILIKYNFKGNLEMKKIIYSLLFIIISWSCSYGNDISLSSNYYIVHENQKHLPISIVRHAISPTEISVAYQVTGGTATPFSDYTPVDGQLIFANGEIQKTITIPIIDNNGAELFETVLIKLVNPSSDATLITPYQATILLIDDEQTFQWQSPTFPCDKINDLWQSPDESLWAIYDNGLVLKFNQYKNFECQQVLTHVSANLNAIWGTHDSNIYVVANDGIILHYDGTEFSKVPTPTDRDLLTIWGTDTGFIVAGGVGNTLIQRTETQPQWKRIKQGQLSDPDIYAVWGTDDHNFFAVGGKMALNGDGIIYYYYGPRWEIALNRSQACFTDIWGMNATYVQVCGRNEENKGIIAFYNGYEWSVQEMSDDPFTKIWGFDTKTKSVIGITQPLLSTMPAVGYFQNNSWHPFDDSPVDRITAISGNSLFNVSIADTLGQIYRFDSQTFTQYQVSFRNNLKAIWGTNDQNLYAVGENGAIYHSDGFAWTKESEQPDVTFNDVFGLSDQQIMAVGNNGNIYAYDGDSWEAYLSITTNDLYGLWGDASDNAYAVGQSGTILHYNGMEWTQITPPATTHLYDIGSTASNIFAVGSAGIILRYQNDEWHIERKPMDDQKDLYAIWGDPNSDTAYAVGQSGVVLQYAGQWQTIRSFDDHAPDLFSVMPFTDKYIVACGTQGHMLIYDDINWIPLPIPTTQGLNAIWGENDTNMTIVGDNGTIIRYAAPLKLSGPSEASEGDVSEINVQIFPEEPHHLPIDVTFKTNPVNDVTLPSHIKLKSGHISDDVTVQFNHDNMSDGANWVDIMASAAGHQQAVFHIQVFDTNDRLLSLDVPSIINESDGIKKCAISIDAPADDNISVRLHSSRPEQLSIPSMITVPKGYTTVQFFIAPRDDYWIDGLQAVPVSAMVPGWAVSISQTILVEDNEIQSILIDGPNFVREEMTCPPFEAWIRLSAIPETEFQLDLSVSDATELSVPSHVTAHTGQQIIPLTLQVVDDQIVDGDQHVCISVSAPGWTSSEYTITVEDNEPGKVQFVFETYHVSENEQSALIDLYRTDSESGTITVICQTQPVSAEKNLDYQSIITPIVFHNNENYKSLTITIYPDALAEPLEFLDIQMTPSPESASWIGDKSIAQLFIHDDDWQVNWQNPLPQGNTLNAIASISNQQMIAVGDKGTIIHWNGTNSLIQNQLPPENLHDIFVVSSSEIYVVGDNATFLSYDGMNWHRELQFSPFHIYCIWGPGSEHLFAAGEQASIFMRENEMWHPIYHSDENKHTFYDIWGASKEKVFFVGRDSSQGMIYEWDGATVTSMSIPECKTLYCVWGTDENNVYAAGDGRVILHYNGSQWQVMQQYHDDSCIHDIWGPDNNHIYAVGGDLNGGLLLHKNNEKWEKEDYSFYHWLNGISGKNNHVMVVGENGSVASRKMSETEWTQIVNAQGDLKGIWGRHANDIFVVGENQFKHYTGNEWQAFTLNEWHPLNSVHGDENILFAVGASGTILSYENNQIHYHAIETNIHLKDVWGIQGTFYAVGEQASILVYTGTTWQEMIHPLQGEDITFHSIWGVSAKQVYVVGENNHILQYNGSDWRVRNAPESNQNQTIYAIWGRSVNDFYIACDNGNVFHYQDQWLEPENLGAIQYDMFLWEDQIVSVGDNGIHQYNEIWTKLETGTDNALYGVWAFENKIFAVGCASTQLLLEGQIPKTYTLTVQILPAESGTIYVNGLACTSQCEILFHDLEELAVEALPLTDFHFVSWAKDLTGQQSNDSLLMTENKTIAALFKKSLQTVLPDAILPKNGEIISGSSVELIGALNTDVSLVEKTFWQIRKFDQPYTCSTYQFQSRICHQSDRYSLTSYVLTEMIDGYQYAWQFGYQEINQSNIYWSNEKKFIIGTQNDNRNIIIDKGDRIRDYRILSFVQWFPDNRVEAVIGPNLKHGYDTRFIRFATYDPISGSYIEYGDRGLFIIPGKSYWVLTSVDIPMPLSGVPVGKSEPIEIKLDFGQDGWNMIAAPNHVSYTWHDIQVVAYDDLNMPIDLQNIMSIHKERYVIADMIETDNTIISPFLWKWVDGSYKQTAYLDPYEGYWVKTYRSNVRLRFNPDAQLPSGQKRMKMKQRHDIDLPPLPMSGFGDGVNDIGSGCLIDNIVPYKKCNERKE